MKNFLKGIIVGLGGIAPGLSGSVLLIIFGLYQKTLDALGNLFGDFKKNVIFLVPVISGMGIGVILFSKILDFFLGNFEMQTRFCFLGLILGTIPLVYKEVKKEGYSRKYYVLVVLAAVAGTLLFTLNPTAFPQVTDPTLFQCIFLGVAVAASSIIPGVDSAVILTTLGLYELYVGSLADLDLAVLLPAGIGLGIGAIGISFVMSWLFRHYYTIVYSIIFGLFLSMIPNMLNENCVPGMNGATVVSVVVMVIGFFVSFYLGDIEGNNREAS